MEIDFTGDMWYSKENRIFLIVCLLAVCSISGMAQYHPQYSQYMFNGLALNPAYAGSKDVLNLAAIYRTNHFTNNFEGTPVTQTFAGDFPLTNPNLAFGLTLFNDKINIINQSGAYFAYSYRVIAGEGKLSFGMQAGFDIIRENQSKISLFDLPDALFLLEPHSAFLPNIR